jgi:hypothetical protein
MAKKRDEEPGESGGSQSPAPWLALAREEIVLRLEVDGSEHEAAMERELQMHARLKVHYPDMPPELVGEFSRRLQIGYFAWEAWDDAVAWLEGTKWFRQRSRYRT